MPIKIPHRLLVLEKLYLLKVVLGSCAVLAIGVIVFAALLFQTKTMVSNLTTKNTTLAKQLTTTTTALTLLKNEDQYKKNQLLQADLKTTHDDYIKSILLYEKIIDLKDQKQDTTKLSALYAAAVKQLADLNHASSEATLIELDKQIGIITTALNASQTSGGVPAGAPVSNTAPGSGFAVQQVTSDVGVFPVALIAADLNSTRVIVDTASDGDCSNNCPVMPLADYVSRNGAFAGINGSFFCPADYPSCAGKVNSFDTLLMNKNKKYFNSDNNVYSTVPLVYFSGSSMGVRGQSSQWGRDTGVDSVIAMQPLLVSGGNIVYGGGGSDKYEGKGLRGFIGNKGSTVYIGFVYNATMSDSAHVLKALGLENALNLDEGGSSALWSGGYKVGPGRNIPNAVLFVRK